MPVDSPDAVAEDRAIIIARTSTQIIGMFPGCERQMRLTSSGTALPDPPKRTSLGHLFAGAPISPEGPVPALARES